MGGEDTEKNISGADVKPEQAQDVFDTSLSRLLQDFNSAELFPNAPAEVLKTTEPQPDICDDDVLNSMKHLHLRKPAISKQKHIIKVSDLKKNSPNTLNLAIAACGVPKPIVWPARLSSQSDKNNSRVLRPSRLTVGKQTETSVETSAASELTACSEKEPNLVKPSHIFGEAASNDNISLSFSSLCKPDLSSHSGCNGESPSLCSESCRADAESVRVCCKRHRTCDMPPAKLSRKRSENNNEPGQSQSVFSFYRTPNLGALGSNQLRSPWTAASLELSDHTASPTLHNSSFSCGSMNTCRTTVAASSEEGSMGRCSLAEGTDSAVLRSNESQGNSGQLPLIQEVPDSLHDELEYAEPTQEELSVNELASYFEDYLYIPRKMSKMAEMMYA